MTTPRDNREFDEEQLNEMVRASLLRRRQRREQQETALLPPGNPLTERLSELIMQPRSRRKRQNGRQNGNGHFGNLPLG